MIRRLTLLGFIVTLLLSITLYYQIAVAAPLVQQATPSARQDVPPSVQQTATAFQLTVTAAIQQTFAPTLAAATPTATATPELPVTTTITVTLPTPLPTADKVTPISAIGEWGQPYNLSRSGATSDPQMVIDNLGRTHVLWRDEIDGFVYIVGNGETWSSPAAIELPFSTRRYFPELEPEQATPRFAPLLVADRNGLIHAFWVDTETDEAGILYHSSVPVDLLTIMDAWTPRQELERGAIRPSAAVGTDGRLHLAYVRQLDTATTPAGIYYRRFTFGSWSDPQLIYPSRYLRALSAAEANVQILAVERQSTQQVFIAWDDVGREQVFVSQSANGGESWGTALEIDRRAAEDAPDSVGPGKIILGADANSVVLTWQAGHEVGQTCTQYYRSLPTDSADWSLPQPLAQLPACLSTAEFMNSNGNLFLLGTIVPEGQQASTTPATTYLLAWDGTRWSDPQEQTLVSGFINLDTNQQVQLGCLQALGRVDLIDLLGCDQGMGADIWWTTRAMGDIAAWFPPPAVWQGPEEIARSTLAPIALRLVADWAGTTHAFWYDGQSQELYYARWNGQSWSAATPVMTSANGNIEQIAVATYNDRLYLVFRDPLGIHFSQSSIERPSDWSAPVLLTEGYPSASAPDILVERGGQIIVAYALPLNETRGIYLVRSLDHGDTWTAPRQVFDGTAAGWEMVDAPRLGHTANGHLHLLWTRRSLPPESTPLSLAYSHSADDGQSWSAAEEAVEGAVVWSALLGVDERIIHRLWVEEASERHFLWHAFSIDNGLSWSRPGQITSLEGDELPATAVDPGGRPHILTLSDGRLQQWTWEGEGWRAADSLPTTLADGGLLGAAADSAGRLVALYAGSIPGTSEEGTAGAELYAMARPLDLAAEALPPPPTLTPTPQPTATPVPAATPIPTPTVVLPAGPVDSGLLSGLDSTTGLVVAIIPALLVVTAAVFIGVRAVRLGRGS